MADDLTDSFKPEQMAKMLEAFKIPGLDAKALVTAQQKNVEAVTQATQVIATGASDIAKKQAEMVRGAVEQAMSFSSGLKGADPGAIAKAQQDLIKTAFETGLANARELAEMVQRSNTEAYQTIAKRMKDSLEELKASTQRQP